MWIWACAMFRSVVGVFVFVSFLTASFKGAIGRHLWTAPPRTTAVLWDCIAFSSHGSATASDMRCRGSAGEIPSGANQKRSECRCRVKEPEGIWLPDRYVTDMRNHGI